MSEIGTMRNYPKNRLFLSVLLGVSLIFSSLLTGYNASALSLSQTMVRFDRMKINTQTTGTICFRPGTTGTADNVQVVFPSVPSSYTLGLAATFTVNATPNASWPSGASGLPGVATANDVTGQTVTFPFTSTSLSNSTTYCFNWTNPAAVTTIASASPSNRGSVTTRNGSTPVDTENYSTATIANDEIVVNATVPAIFDFSLSANVDNLPTLDTTAVVTSSPATTATVSTNATNGWIVWAKDTAGALSSAAASYSIPSTSIGANFTLVGNSIGYNFGVTAGAVGGGAVAVPDAAYIGTALGQGGGLDATFRPVASATGPSNGATMNLKNNVAITTLVPAAADYTDTISVVGAGLF